MKILKQADTSSWSYKATCDKCESELQVEPGDLCHIHHEGYDMREPAWDEYYASCPVCSGTIGVPESKVPKALRISVQQKYAAVGNR